MEHICTIIDLLDLIRCLTSCDPHVYGIAVGRVVRYESHCHRCNDLHILSAVVSAWLTVRVVLKLSGARCKLYLLTEKIELIMLRQCKMLCGPVRQLDIDSGIDSGLTCLTDLSFFRCLQLFPSRNIRVRWKDLKAYISSMKEGVSDVDESQATEQISVPV